jgi:hypothetical protein
MNAKTINAKAEMIFADSVNVFTNFSCRKARAAEIVAGSPQRKVWEKYHSSNRSSG